MNASRLIAWLRRRSWRRENLPAARRQRTIHAPELLEPRTVLSAMPFSGLDADDGEFSGRAEYEAASPALAAINLAAYVARAENAERSLDRLVFSSPEIARSGLEPVNGSLLASSEQVTYVSSKVTIATQYFPLTSDVSLQVTSFFITTPLTYSLRGPWLSSTLPPGSLSSGPSSDAVGSASDGAEDEESGAGYGRNYIVASMPSLSPEAPIFVMVDGWRWNAALPATGVERGSMSSSSASEAQEAASTYGRTTASGSLLADELTTHLVHAEESHGTRASTSLVINPLATTSTSLTDAARRAADGLDDRLTDPWMAGEGGDQRGNGESDGMIDLERMGTLRRGRRLAANPATQAQCVNPRLARLTDLALLRDAPSLMRELAQIARDALFAADNSPEAGPPEHADDRMLDLLAADVGTLGQTSAAAIFSTGAPAASRPLSLEAGVALYQAFDLALAEETASGGGAQASNSAGAAQAMAATEEPRSAE